MDKRKQLIDMISDHKEQRYLYTIVIVLTNDALTTWEEYDKEADQYIEVDAYNDEVYLLTPEQAKQLGDVRDYNILLQSGYHDKLVELGLAKRTY